ncbi:MAG: aldolase [Clostridia bacterium]|nr:aldolase [Clostridia bacterium]
MKKIKVPLSVPKDKRTKFKNNYKLATNNTGNLLLFAGDQKVEHLNDDFVGSGISLEDGDPEHLFKIAKSIPGAVLATHIGLLSQYGEDYKQLPFILKVNGKTNLNDTKDSPYNGAWLGLEDIINFKNQSELKIVGLGYTIYLGSKQEAQMLKEAATTIMAAHQAGILAIIWMYPRHSKIKNEDDTHLIAGGAGVAASLGADFVKVKYPYKTANSDQKAKSFQEVVKAAGRTKIICVGGAKQDANELLIHLSRQLKNGTAGLAIGRNLHQRSLTEASQLGKALSAMIHSQASKSEAVKILKSKKEIKTNKKAKVKNLLMGLF